jgi:hypothetical protein
MLLNLLLSILGKFIFDLADHTPTSLSLKKLKNILEMRALGMVEEDPDARVRNASRYHLSLFRPSGLH